MHSRSLPRSPLALQHPPLPAHRTSYLPTPTPRTPRSYTSPLYSLFLSPPPNRNSTDSWTSSNGPDPSDPEWKAEQVLLLSRTLDALPAHLLTPFNGPVPPNNLLDKIARGVADAKGPADWPHSIRATRVKLLELSRLRAKDEGASYQRRTIYQESDPVCDIENKHTYPAPDTEHTAVSNLRRPVYKQSSMDFIKNDRPELKNNDNITRLSTRLQRDPFHPYSRNTKLRPSISQPAGSCVPSLSAPSTPSSSTLNTVTSITLATCSRIPRRSPSTFSLSTSSSSSYAISTNGNRPLPDPRVQRVRLSDPFCTPSLPQKRKDINAKANTSAGTKRVADFSAISRKEKHVAAIAPTTTTTELAASAHVRRVSGGYPSSDEEERARAKTVKKARVKSTGTCLNIRKSPDADERLGSSINVESPRILERPRFMDRILHISETPSVRTPPMTPSIISSPPAIGLPRHHQSAKRPEEQIRRQIRPDIVDQIKAIGEDMNMGDGVGMKPEGRTGSGEGKRGRKRVGMNPHRNPSMFGAELPHIKGSGPTNASSGGDGVAIPRSRNNGSGDGILTSVGGGANDRKKLGLNSPISSSSPLQMGLEAGAHVRLGASLQLASSPSSSPLNGTRRTKTLRRVSRLMPVRQILFGSLVETGKSGM